MARGKYRIMAFGSQVGIGVAGSWHATIGAVAKSNGPDVPYCIPNELISAEVGRFLQLPIPPSGLMHSAGANPPDWFASLDFNLATWSLFP
jgi:hypothetical protein